MERKFNLKILSKRNTQNIPEANMKKDLEKLSENSIFLLQQWKKLSPESKKKYPDGLVSLLDEISGLRQFKDIKEGTEFLKKFIKITSLKQVQEEIKSIFEFIEREEGKSKVEECAINNFISYKKAIKGSTKSQDVGFVIVSGGSGSGKTRATKEIFGILKNLSFKEAIFQNTCSIYFDFKNGDSIQTLFENDTDQIY